MQGSLQLAMHAKVAAAGVRKRSRHFGARQLLPLMILAYAMTRESRAADESFRGPEFALLKPATALRPDFALPSNFVAEPAAREFSATDFSPHQYPAFGAAPLGAPAAGPSRTLGTTTVWQRLAEYRSHDRVRLVTLWESPGSTLSLQAGKRGEPSLQWTSRAMNRGGSTRGLLDWMIVASIRSAGAGPLHNLARSGQPVVMPRKTALASLPSLAENP